MHSKRICLIDLSGVARQQWHATEHEGASAMVRKTLQAVTGFAAGCGSVGICIDTPPYKRSEVSQDYKAHREKVSSAYHEQLRVVIDQLDRDGYHILGAKGYEADDIIATVCDWTTSRAHRYDIVVYSADKDMLQLVRQGREDCGSVTVISSATGTKYETAEAVVAKLGVRPSLVPDWLALVGDKSDGLPGVNGVGPKTASTWLDRYGSVEAVLLNADKLEPERFREAVVSGRNVIGTSFQLAQLLDDAPIKPEVIMERKEVKREAIGQDEDDAIGDALDVQRESVALVPVQQAAVQPVEFERALEPRDSGGAMKLAHYLFQSRMFGQFPTPEAVLAIILAGRAHGLGAFQALQGFHNVKGRPSASAQMIVGLCKRHSACRYFRLVEATAEKATYETLREGEPEPTRMTYTIEQAKLAKLTGKDNWQNDPQAMLIARASSRLARAVYPDICAGLLTPDEVEDG